jgi:hypothetical protein
MNTSSYILLDLLIAQTQHGIAARLEIGVFAYITFALLWGAMPVFAIAFNDKHCFRESKITQELITYHILKLICNTRLIKRFHQSALNAGRTRILQCHIAYQRMFDRFVWMRSLPFANRLTERGAARFVLFPLKFYRIASGSARYAKIGHQSMDGAGIRKTAIACDLRHAHAFLHTAFKAFYQRLAKRCFCFCCEVAPAQLVTARKRACLFIGVAWFTSKQPATDRTRINHRRRFAKPAAIFTAVNITFIYLEWIFAARAYFSNHIAPLITSTIEIIPQIQRASNCARAFSPVVET